MPGLLATEENLSAKDDTRKMGVARLKDKFGQIFAKNVGQKMGIESLIEKDYLYDNNSAFLESSSVEDLSKDYANLPKSPTYGTFDEELDDQACTQVYKKLEQCIIDVKDSPALCHLIIAEELLLKISRDIVRMSLKEPCGVKGLLLYMNLHHKGSVQKLSKVDMDPTTVPTFELDLTLQEEKKVWVHITDLFLPLVKLCVGGGHRKKVNVSPGYQLVKKKLYRSN